MEQPYWPIEETLDAGFAAEYPYEVPSSRNVVVQFEASEPVAVSALWRASGGPEGNLDHTIVAVPETLKQRFRVPFPPNMQPGESWYLLIWNTGEKPAKVKHTVETLELRTPVAGATGTSGGWGSNS